MGGERGEWEVSWKRSQWQLNQVAVRTALYIFLVKLKMLGRARDRVVCVMRKRVFYKTHYTYSLGDLHMHNMYIMCVYVCLSLRFNLHQNNLPAGGWSKCY